MATMAFLLDVYENDAEEKGVVSAEVEDSDDEKEIASDEDEDEDEESDDEKEAPDAPYFVRDRVIGGHYKRNGVVHRWDGVSWTCVKHHRRYDKCGECEGNTLCMHKKRRHNCKQCGGTSVCMHGKRRSRCVDCGGTSMCTHGRDSYTCIECGGKGICTHGRQRHHCVECGGKGVCAHGKQRTHCSECGGSCMCSHGIVRSNCYRCGGNNICKLCKHTTMHPAYKPHCVPCHNHLHPEAAVTTRLKSKEGHLQAELQKTFTASPYTWNKSVDGGCSGRRPDFRWECNTHSVIVECDERQHTSNSPECEHKRAMQLWLDLGSRPLVLIRFNPDGYRNATGARVRSCFKVDRTVNVEEWTTRFTALRDEINKWLTTVPVKEAVTQIDLFFSSVAVSNTEAVSNRSVVQ